MLPAAPISRADSGSAFVIRVAQQTTTPSTTLSESLSEEVNDPTATLTQAQIQEFFTPSEYGTNAQPNTLQFAVTSVIPKLIKGNLFDF